MPDQTWKIDMKKLCKMCFKQKQLDQFYDDFGQRDTKMVWCKDCTKKYRRDRYKKQKEVKLNNSQQIN